MHINAALLQVFTQFWPVCTQYTWYILLVSLFVVRHIGKICFLTLCCLTDEQLVVMIPLRSLMSFLPYSGGRQKQKAAPADQNRGCQQQLHLMPYKDLTPLVTSLNWLIPLWTAACREASWQSIPVLLPRAPSVTNMRMWHVRPGRAALWPMTSTRPAKLRAGRLVGWKMRSMDNTVDTYLVSASVLQPHSCRIWPG